MVTIEIVDCNCKNRKPIKSRRINMLQTNAHSSEVISTRGGGAQISTGANKTINKQKVIARGKANLNAELKKRNIVQATQQTKQATKKVTPVKVVKTVVNPASLIKNKKVQKVATVLTNPVKGTVAVAKGTAKAVKKVAKAVSKVNPVNKIKNKKVKTAVQVATNPIKGTKVVAKATVKAVKKAGKATKKAVKKVGKAVKKVLKKKKK